MRLKSFSDKAELHTVRLKPWLHVPTFARFAHRSVLVDASKRRLVQDRPVPTVLDISRLGGRSILPLRVKTPVYSVTTRGIHQVYTPLYTTVHLYTPLKYAGVYTYVYTSLITPVMTLYTVYTPIMQVYLMVYTSLYRWCQGVRPYRCHDSVRTVAYRGTMWCTYTL